MASQHSIGATAKMIGTSTTTIRRLAADFSDYLPDYQHVAGKARKFSDDDVKTLHAILTRLKATPGTSRSDLLTELSALGSEPFIIPATLPIPIPDNLVDKSPDKPQQAIIRQAIQTGTDLAQNAIQPFLEAQDMTRQQVADLSAQITDLSRQVSQKTPAKSDVASLIAVGSLVIGVTALIVFDLPDAPAIASLVALLVWIVAFALRR